jgi:protein involved in polysaccharide export with SLBB domain
MDRSSSTISAHKFLLFAGLSLAVNHGGVVLGQTTPVGLSSGIPVAQPVYPPSYAPTTFSGASAASLLNSMDALNDQTKLKAGDQLSFRVIEEQKQQPDILTVSDTGEIEVPLLGRFPAAGKTCRQLANQLKPVLEKDYYYKATVIIGIDTLSVKPVGKVYLEGQVKSQGALDIPPDDSLTVSRAILMDGGLADFADRRRVRLMHRNADGTTKTTIVDLKEILDRGHADKDPLVQDGDTITVPQRLINF